MYLVYIQNKTNAEDLNIDQKKTDFFSNNDNDHNDPGTDTEKEVRFTGDFMDDKSVSLKVQSTKLSTSDESYDQLDHETGEARDHNVSDVDTIPNKFFNLNNISEDFTH